jgi:hypothetical protein
MIERIVRRDQRGQIIHVLERTLRPTEEAAALLYLQIDAISRGPQPDPTPTLVIDPDAIHHNVDRVALLDLVRDRAAADLELFSRSGWSQFTLRIGESSPRPTPAAPAPKTVRPGFI